MSEKKILCLITGCGREVKSRGLCQSHYTIASGRVKAKTGSWVEFEKLGVSLKPSRVHASVSSSQFDAALSAARKK